MLKQELITYLEYIDSHALDETNPNYINSNSFFINDDTIICTNRKTGDSRHPYSKDGFTVWAYASGYVNIGESAFYVIPPVDEGKEPYFALFGGVKQDNQKYIPYSITGVACQPNEDVKRYTVFTPYAVFYITRTESIDFCSRIYVDDDKKVHITNSALNRGDRKEIYLSSFMNFLLMYTPFEDVETKWFKECHCTPKGFIAKSTVDISRDENIENYCIVNREITAQNVDMIQNTSSRFDFTGGKNVSLNCCESLTSGEFERNKKNTKFTETAACGDIVHINLDENEFARVDYVLKVVQSEEKARYYYNGMNNNPQEIDAFYDKKMSDDKIKFASDDMLKLKFVSSHIDGLGSEILTSFVKNVIRQVEYCALAKNSGVSLLGVRDVYQQLEACLIFNKLGVRNKIIESLNYLNIDGRLPRQYSIPAREGSIPQMDLREFIDQGVWVINTLYQYLAYHNDYSILDELCGYYKFGKGNSVSICEKKDTVLQHLLLITDYLINHIDENTHCLRIMFGDWNDALNGLGKPMDDDKEFGSGVSVMATLQFYANLKEMIEILSKVGGYEKQIEKYTKVRALIAEGIMKYAIVSNDSGERKILHGWGDKRSYFVGSYKDVDDISRDALTANAFWVISGAINLDTSLKEDILRAYRNLDSKYGLKTFEPYFERNVKGVGRIINLPKGTAENGATYIHATMFGIMSLFMMGEGELAFNQLKKVLPITHKSISTTPFVMPNSYAYNTEFEMDGESMNDWFTGSANVLIKTIVRNFFGFNASLDGVVIKPSNYIPFDKIEMNLTIRDKNIKFIYNNMNYKKPLFIVNNEHKTTKTDNMSLSYLELSYEELLTKNIIEINF